MYSHHRIPRAAQMRQPRQSTSATGRNGRHGRSTIPLGSIRPTVLLLAKALLVPLASAAPLSSLWTRDVSTFAGEPEPIPPDDPNLWVYLGVAIALVLLGGAFAGLTIALMGQDETYLQVLAASGEGSEKKNAEKVLALLNRGKHWVLVTLLLSNVITNETLPIVLDRSLGGGWPAVLGSTVLIVIFGEIVPQSICVRYGLGIGAWMAPLVLSLMWIMAPVAWPTAKLLDYLLGKDHGTTYKKAGLKTLVTLHKSLGGAPSERLMEDEVTIINSVLDLKDKPVGDIMTPMQDVFTMSADTILDESMMDTILSQGYSRIPIYAPDNSRNFIGMLLVKILITYDPEDARKVREFSLATLPETAPFTSCLDIINFFQEGKSHMVLVSDFPGKDRGALGVVTLEDVIEELIGEEIIDESDVFVDVHKAIRRLAPAPRNRFKREDTGTLEPSYTNEEYQTGRGGGEAEPLLVQDGTPSRKTSMTNGGPGTTFLVRRKSSTASDPANGPVRPVPIHSNTAEMREHLKHLGPSNAASKPRATKFTSVKIKPGVGTIPEDQATTKGTDVSEPQSVRSRSADATPDTHIPMSPGQESEAERLIRSAGKEASGGAAAIRAVGSYGTMTDSPTRPPGLPRGQSALEASQIAKQKASPDSPDSLTSSSSTQPPPGIDGDRARDLLKPPEKMVVGSTGAEGEDGDTVSDLAPSRQRSQSRRQARSGSITETEVEVGGFTKMVLEMSSSSEEDEAEDDKSGKQKGSGSSKDSSKAK